MSAQNILGGEGRELVDFVGIDHLLSHNRVWIDSFLYDQTYPYSVDIVYSLVGVIMLRGCNENMQEFMVGTKGFCGQTLQIINYKKRKKRRFNGMPLDLVYID